MTHLKTLLTIIAVSLLATFAHAQQEYQIRSGDTLAIEVFEDPDLNRSVVVLSDGRISFRHACIQRIEKLRHQQRMPAEVIEEVVVHRNLLDPERVR